MKPSVREAVEHKITYHMKLSIICYCKLNYIHIFMLPLVIDTSIKCIYIIHELNNSSAFKFRLKTLMRKIYSISVLKFCSCF